ncbi:MAG: hypothetical protein CSA75_05245, partial [Sorangium cellulosum]
GESFVFAWDRIKSDPATILGTFIGGGFVSSIVSLCGQLILRIDPQNIAFQSIGMLAFFLNFAISTFMWAGITLFGLKVARGEPYEFTDIFRGGRYFLPMLLAFLISSVGVLLGVLLLIVPGVILSLGWTLTVPLIVDKNLGVFAAFKESWRLMKGQKLSFFLWSLATAGLVVLGLMACCVGVLVVTSAFNIAHNFIYLRITGQRTAELSTAA